MRLPYKEPVLVNFMKEKTKATLFPCKYVVFDDVIHTVPAYLIHLARDSTVW